eukprot:g7308.t1
MREHTVPKNKWDKSNMEVRLITHESYPPGLSFNQMCPDTICYTHDQQVARMLKRALVVLFMELTCRTPTNKRGFVMLSSGSNVLSF